MTVKRDILHIVAGDPETHWEPTQAELVEIQELFSSALFDPVKNDEKHGVIVTRSGITATVLSVSEGAEIRVTSAQVTKADMAKRIDSTEGEQDDPEA